MLPTVVVPPELPSLLVDALLETDAAKPVLPPIVVPLEALLVGPAPVDPFEPVAAEVALDAVELVWVAAAELPEAELASSFTGLAQPTPARNASTPRTPPRTDFLICRSYLCANNLPTFR